MKRVSDILKDKRYKSPRLSSPTREVELAVRSAREDICFNIAFATSVLLFAGGHWVIGVLFALLTIYQGLDAVACEVALRIERWKIDLSNTDVNGGP